MLKPFYGEKGILEILLERILEAFPVGFNKIAVATSVADRDDRIEHLCSKMGLRCFRGSESDVLDRFIMAAEAYGADKLIRVCADNVFLETSLLVSLYERVENSTCDYVSYCKSDGTPSIKTHYGFWAEGVVVDALKRVRSLTDDKLFHEHVTNYIYSHPNKFSIDMQPIDETIKNIEAFPNIRLTVDTAEDFAISRDIYKWFVESNMIISGDALLDFLKTRQEYFDKMAVIINQNSK